MKDTKEYTYEECLDASKLEGVYEYFENTLSSLYGKSEFVLTPTKACYVLSWNRSRVNLDACINHLRLKNCILKKI